MIEQILNSTRLFLPETALTVTFCAVILADLLFAKSRITASLTLAGLFAALFFLLRQPQGVPNSIFSNMLAVDPFSTFFRIVILISAILIVLFSFQSSELNAPRRGLGEY